MRKSGFSLLEVVIALAIALLMLSALISLEIKSTALAARATMGLKTLPVAIEKLEEVSQKQFSGTKSEMVDEFEVQTRAVDFNTAEIPYTRIQVEVFYNGQLYSELSTYNFKL